MKKLSKAILVLASTAMILANGFLVSCSSGDDDDSSSIPTPASGNNGNSSGSNGGNSGNGGNNSGNGGNNSGNGSGTQNGNPGSAFTVPDLSSYYKKYFVSTDSSLPNFGKTVDTWGSGAGASPNQDGTCTLTSAHMWGESNVEGVVAAFNDIEAGNLASFEYIVFTVDASAFSFTNTTVENDGVNVKIPDVMVSVTNKVENNANGTKTFYAPISEFNTAPQTANQIALIIGGSGSLVVKEIYAAARENPSSRAVTGITITPASANVLSGATTRFVVKDSNFTDVTNSATFEMAGTGSTGCTIDNGLFTAGSTPGAVTVTARYTSNGNEFTSSASVNVVAVASQAKELFSPNTEGYKLDGILPLVNTVDWGGTNTAPASEQINGVDAVVLTVPEGGISGWGISVAWQGGTNDKISLVGYDSISITVKDEFGGENALTGAHLKIKGGNEGDVVATVSEPNENGWRTITASLNQYSSVDLGAVTCIHLSDWTPQPAAGGKLHIIKVTLNPAS